MGAMSRHHSCEAGGKLFAAGAMISLIALFRPGGIRVYDGQFLFTMIVLLTFVTIIIMTLIVIVVVSLAVF